VSSIDRRNTLKTLNSDVNHLHIQIKTYVD
jgi:hypothetical protein